MKVFYRCSWHKLYHGEHRIYRLDQTSEWEELTEQIVEELKQSGLMPSDGICDSCSKIVTASLISEFEFELRQKQAGYNERNSLPTLDGNGDTGDG